MELIDNIISAIRNAGIECFREYDYTPPERGITAFAGIKGIRLEQLRDGLSDVAAQVRVTVRGQSAGEVTKIAGEKIIPAVMGCGEEVSGVEISDSRYDVKTERVYTEILFEIRRCGYDICGG